MILTFSDSRSGYKFGFIPALKEQMVEWMDGIDFDGDSSRLSRWREGGKETEKELMIDGSE